MELAGEGGAAAVEGTGGEIVVGSHGEAAADTAAKLTEKMRIAGVGVGAPDGAVVGDQAGRIEVAQCRDIGRLRVGLQALWGSLGCPCHMTEVVDRPATERAASTAGQARVWLDRYRGCLVRLASCSHGCFFVPDTVGAPTARVVVREDEAVKGAAVSSDRAAAVVGLSVGSRRLVLEALAEERGFGCRGPWLAALVEEGQAVEISAGEPWLAAAVAASIAQAAPLQTRHAKLPESRKA